MQEGQRKRRIEQKEVEELEEQEADQGLLVIWKQCWVWLEQFRVWGEEFGGGKVSQGEGIPQVAMVGLVLQVKLEEEWDIQMDDDCDSISDDGTEYHMD